MQKRLLKEKSTEQVLFVLVFEMNNADETMKYGTFERNYKDLISSTFAETDLIFTNNLTAKIGARSEHSSYLDKWNFSPRAALAYQDFQRLDNVFSLRNLYQNPESKYLYSKNFDFQRA